MTDRQPSSDTPGYLFFKGMVLAAIVIAVDQGSKIWVLHGLMTPPRVIEVTPNFNLVLAWNRGVSFGLFNEDSDYGAYVLSTLALAIVTGLSVWLWKSKTRWSAIALALVIGGALGNVIDRIRYGAVADFLDFHAFGSHWPAFNFADTAICIGAGLLIAESLFIPDQTI